MDKLKYLGIAKSNGEGNIEVQEKIQTANGTCHSCKNMI